MARRPRLSSTPLGDFVSASCDGKLSFDSYHQASQIADRRGRRRNKGQPYRCPFCRLWHIGSPKPRRRHPAPVDDGS